MDSPPSSSDHQRLPDVMDGSGHSVLRHESDHSENEEKTEHATPQLPTNAAPTELLTNSHQKSSFADWKKLVTEPSSHNDAHALTGGAEEAVTVGDEKLLPERDVEESSASEEPLLSTVGVQKKDELLASEDIAIKTILPEFPPFRSSTLAAVTAPAPSESALDDTDLARLHLPPEEALSDIMMSFLDHQQMPSVSGSSDELQTTNSIQARSRNGDALVQLAHLTQQSDETTDDEDPDYFDINHDKELDSALFVHSGTSNIQPVGVDGGDELFPDAQKDDKWLPEIEPVNTVEDYEHQYHDIDCVRNDSPGVCNEEFYEGSDVANVEIVEWEKDPAQRRRMPDFTLGTVEELTGQEEESADDQLSMDAYHDVSMLQNDSNSSDISKRSHESLIPDFYISGAPPESNSPSSLQHNAWSSEPESLLQYANLAANALNSNAETFVVKRRESPVAYDEIAFDIEENEGTMMSDVETATNTEGMNIKQAIRNVPESGGEIIDNETYDSVMEQSEGELGHDIKINTVVEEAPIGSQRILLQNQSDSKDTLPDSVFSSNLDEADGFGTDLNASTVQHLSDSLNVHRLTETKTALAVNPSSDLQLSEPTTDSLQDSLLDESKVNSETFVVNTTPVTTDWLSQLVSQPLVETKPDSRPVQQPVPTSQKYSASFQQQYESIVEPEAMEKDKSHEFGEPIEKVARISLQGNAALFNKDSIELGDRKSALHENFATEQNFDKNQFIEVEKKPGFVKLEELDETDDVPPPIPPFNVAQPKRPTLDNDKKFYIKTMAREQRERLLLSIADGTIAPGGVVRVEDPMSGKVIEVTPKDFVQIIKENPVPENEYDYLQGAASVLDRYEVPSQRGSFAPPKTPQTPEIPPFYPRGFAPRHPYDEFDQRPKSQAMWEPTPAPRTRFSLAAPSNYNPRMNPSLTPPPPMYLDQQHPFQGIEMTQQSAYPFNTNIPPSPVGYPYGMPAQPAPTLNQPAHQEQQAPPYPLYNLHPPGLIQQPQPPPQVAPAQPNVIAVNPAPVAPVAPVAPPRAGHKDYREEDGRRGRRSISSDEESGGGRKQRRYDKRQPRRRPSAGSVEARNRRGEQDCMKRHCCCWIIVVTLMVLVVILAAAGYFVWIHFWKKDPPDVYGSASTPYSAGNGLMQLM
uniref:Uncharacterized protein n=1 Tax=Plectus sambesii TaxID=2011161 RepID=A0A914WW84_9BILA